MKAGELIDLRKVKQVHKSTVAAGKKPRLELGVLGISIGQEQSTGPTSKVNEAVDIKARNEKHAEQLYKKMVALAKKQAHIGHHEHTVENGVHTVIIENSNAIGKYGFSSDMESLVKDSPLAIFVSRREHEGTFDWPSNTYIKEASEVRFKF